MNNEGLAVTDSAWRRGNKSHLIGVLKVHLAVQHHHYLVTSLMEQQKSLSPFILSHAPSVLQLTCIKSFSVRFHT